MCYVSLEIISFSIARISVDDLAKGLPYTFEEFKEDFSKKYTTEQEEARRKVIEGFRLPKFLNRFLRNFLKKTWQRFASIMPRASLGRCTYL